MLRVVYHAFLATYVCSNLVSDVCVCSLIQHSSCENGFICSMYVSKSREAAAAKNGKCAVVAQLAMCAASSCLW